MINKRLLIKNLLSHNDENSFYDKKQKLSFGSKDGKAKFLKHICASTSANRCSESLFIKKKERKNCTLRCKVVDFLNTSTRMKSCQ